MTIIYAPYWKTYATEKYCMQRNPVWYLNYNKLMSWSIQGKQSKCKKRVCVCVDKSKEPEQEQLLMAISEDFTVLHLDHGWCPLSSTLAPETHCLLLSDVFLAPRCYFSTSVIPLFLSLVTNICKPMNGDETVYRHMTYGKRNHGPVRPIWYVPCWETQTTSDWPSRFLHWNNFTLLGVVS